MFRNAVDLVDIFGFKVKVDPSWLLIAALLVWSLSSSYFPDVLPGLTRWDYLAIATVSMLALFASLIAHELSHSLVARIFGLKVGGITLFVFGGVAELEAEPASPKSEFWIAIAGPAMSFAISAGSAVAAAALESTGVSAVLVAIFAYLALINLVLALFNLVPAFPLDGGRILRAALWYFKEDVFTATRVASAFGTAFGFILIVAGVLSLLASNPVGGLWQILIGSFVVTASKGAYQHLMVKAALKDQQVPSLMSTNPITVEGDKTIRYLVDEVMLEHNKSFIPVVEGDHVLGYINTEIVGAIDKENWSDTRVEDAFAKAEPADLTSSSTPVDEIFPKMVRSGRRKQMVVDDGALSGVLSLSDLMAYLAIREGLGITKPPIGSKISPTKVKAKAGAARELTR